MKRTIEVVSRGTKLSLKDSRVQVRLEKETLASIPVEDLGMVIDKINAEINGLF